MKAWFSMAAALALAAAAYAQTPPATQAPPAQTLPVQDLPKGENVTVTGEKREEVFKQAAAAERAAGEARKEFAGLKDGRTDAALACRKAKEADQEYAQAIAETQALAKDVSQPLKDRLEERVKGMKERRKNLDEVNDRVCGRDGLPKAQRNKGANQLGNNRGRRP
jgi:hypothetical protein